MQLLESLQEMHPDKLPGVLEKHILNGDINSVRQALPSLIQRHPQIRAPLLEIAERLKQPPPQPQPPPLKTTDNPDNDDVNASAAAVTDGHASDVAAIETISGDHAQVFACGNCGGTVSKQHRDSQHVICHFCGCDAIHPPANGLARWRQLLDARSQFTIGSLFNYDHRQWQVIGVQCYLGRIKEWDSEDKKWETNPENFTLWWLLNEQRELAWMSDYGKSRYWSQKFIPFKPQMPANDDKKVEYGEWELMFAAGEFSYMPAAGEQRESREYTRAPAGLDAPTIKSKDYSYSVETGMDENGEPEEIEFIRSRKLSDAQVLSGMGLAKLLDTVKLWSRTSIVFLASIVALPIAYALISLLFDSTNVLTATTPAQVLTPTDIGTLTVENAGENYSIELSSNRFAANRWVEVILDIEDSDGVWAAGVEAEFWHETGNDSDGFWRETDYRVTQQFHFDNPGDYQLTLTPGQTNLEAIPTFNVSVDSHPNPMQPFIFAGFAILVLAFISRTKSQYSATTGASISARLRNNTAADKSDQSDRKQ